MAVILSLDATDEELREFIREWVELLSVEKYAIAFRMLLHVPAYPGQSWCSDPEELRAWIEGYGTDKPEPGERPCNVTSISDTTGTEPNQPILRKAPYYRDFVARLDYWLPIDGEWSDLMASFDFVRFEDGLVGVLRALRVP